jgi:hypothetical protein
LNESFDAAMRDTLKAGKPGPAQLASEQALREAYADWKPGKLTAASDSDDSAVPQRRAAC